VGPTLSLSFSGPVQSVQSNQIKKRSGQKAASSSPSLAGIIFNFSVATLTAADKALLQAGTAIVTYADDAGTAVYQAVSSAVNLDAQTGLAAVEIACIASNDALLHPIKSWNVSASFLGSLGQPSKLSQVGLFQLDLKSKQWPTSTSLQCPSSGNTLVFVHGMLSSVEGAYGSMLANSNFLSTVNYKAVFGVNYEWWNGIDQSGAALAADLDTVAGCTPGTIDIVAHSEGVAVSLYALTHASPGTKSKIQHFVALGGPILGTPIANMFETQLGPLRTALLTVIANFPNQQMTYSSTFQGIQDILNSPFAADLESDGQGTDKLSTIRKDASWQTSLSHVQLIGIAGTNPKLLAPLRDCCGIFESEAFDGVIGQDSALGSAWGVPFSYSNSFSLFHTDLTSDPNVMTAIAGQLNTTSPQVQVAITPSSVTLQPSGTQLFSASVTGAANTNVIWSVAEGSSGGTITSGTYTAPTAAGTFHVLATSQADPTATGTATVNVVATALNPVPSITGLAPSYMVAGSPPVALTVNGTGFLTSSTVTFNGVAHTPSFISASQLIISLSLANLATVGTYPVVVTNPAPGGGTSAAVNLFVTTSTTATAHFSYAQLTLGGGFSFPTGVAVDGSGNVFVADQGNNAVKEILAAGGYTTVKTLGGGFNWPFGVAVDGSGNVFVADTGSNAVKEILAAGGYTTVKTLGSGFSAPTGVAVDGSGNVFVAEWDNSAVKEILAAGGYTLVNTLGSGFTEARGVAVDQSGKVLVADSSNNRVVELSIGAVDFGTVAIGQTSATIPLTFTFDTAGTLGSVAALTGGVSGLDFAVASGGNCTAGTYTAGATCTVNVTFTPKFTGLRSGTVVLKDSGGIIIATAYVHGTGS
jgi:hypothetical protein